MRARTRLVLLLVLVVSLVAPAAASADPATIYTEFVNTGSISCGHSRSDLAALGSDPTIQQYGDPSTMADLKLAAQRAISSGCYRGGAGSHPGTSTGGTQSSTPTSPHATTDPIVTSTSGPLDTTTVVSLPEGTSTGGELVAAGPGSDGGDSGTSIGSFIVSAIVALGVLAGGGIVVRRSLARGR